MPETDAAQQLQKSYSLLNFFNFETSFLFSSPAETFHKKISFENNDNNLLSLLLVDKCSLNSTLLFFLNYANCYSLVRQVFPFNNAEWLYTPSCFFAKFNDTKSSNYTQNNSYFLSNFNMLKSTPIINMGVLFSNNSVLNSIKNIFFTPKLLFNVQKFSSVGNNLTSKSGFDFLRSDIGSVRRLRVTKGICLPSDYPIHIICGSKDVIHSWAIPGLGVKIDCIPGYNCHRRVLFR